MTEVQQLDTAEKAEIFDEVALLEDEIREAEGKLGRAQAQYKARKEEVAGLQAELRKKIWEAAHPEEVPLFNAAPSENGNGEWESILLTEALDGCKPALLQKFTDGNIRTMGELAEWTRTHQLTDIPGIGPAAAQGIEAACEAFWARRKEGVDDE